MKTLIFLIIICSCVAMGQKIPMMTDSGNQWIKNHNFTTGHAIKSTPLTLEDWDEYVKECWSDSTEAGVCISWTADSTQQLSTGGYLTTWKTTYRQEYVHWHKPTFEGFNEWLKRKNNGTE